MSSDHKLTDDSGNAGCLVLACMSMLLVISLVVILVLMIVIVARGCALGCG